jgi:hypothetical protein
VIVETTNYYAKPGREAEVLTQRRLATAIRKSLGLSEGRTFVLLEANGPSVKWQCEFPSQAAYREDMEARNGSTEFAEARAQMHTLIERFERHLHEEAG